MVRPGLFDVAAFWSIGPPHGVDSPGASRLGYPGPCSEGHGPPQNTHPAVGETRRRPNLNRVLPALASADLFCFVWDLKAGIIDNQSGGLAGHFLGFGTQGSSKQSAAATAAAAAAAAAGGGIIGIILCILGR